MSASPIAISRPGKNGDSNARSKSDSRNAPSQTFSWIVNDTALSMHGASLTATEGSDTGSVTVATFTTSDLGAQAGDYTATIDWGDGSSATPGAIGAGTGGGFVVSGTHTYGEEGAYQTTISVGGADSLSLNSTAVVADAALAAERGHLTAAQAGRLAAAAQVGALYLTHISGRYDPVDIAAEAARFFPEVSVANDFDRMSVAASLRGVARNPRHRSST